MWVECFSETPAAERCALVFNRVGVHVARATIPAGLIVHAVDAHRVVGVRRNADGIETIVVYALRR